MTSAKLIKGRGVLTGDEVIADAVVAIEGSRIIETGSAAALSRRYDGAEVIGSEHSAVLPGFVNAHHHSHGVSTIQHGCPHALPESWILGFAGLRKGRVYEETLLSAANQLRSGVTSVVDVVHSAQGTAADYRASVDARLRPRARTEPSHDRARAMTHAPVLQRRSLIGDSVRGHSPKHCLDDGMAHQVLQALVRSRIGSGDRRGKRLGRQPGERRTPHRSCSHPRGILVR